MADGRTASHLIFHDELEEIQLGLSTRIYTLDLADLRSPRVVTSYTGPTGATDHNGYTHGNHYYVSHYRRGVVVFDATNPEALTEVAHFDNYLVPSTNTAGTDGAWGVYPFLPSGNLLVSDIENGLFVLRDLTRNSRRGQRANWVRGAARSHRPRAPGRINVRVQRAPGASEPSVCSTRRPPARRPTGPTTWPRAARCSWAPGDLADKVIGIPVCGRRDRRRRRDTVGDAVGPDRRLDARRLEHVDRFDRRQRQQPAAERRRRRRWRSTDLVLLALLAGVLLARGTRAAAPSADAARRAPATARAPRSTGCADRAADTARAHRAP